MKLVGKLTMLIGAAWLLAGVSLSSAAAQGSGESSRGSHVSTDGRCSVTYSDGCMLDPTSKPYLDWVRVGHSPDAGFELPAQLDSGESIMDVIVAQKVAIRNCITEMHKGSKHASGTVMMHWMIEPDGHVSGVRVLNLQKRNIEPCLVKVINTMRFPAFPGPAYPVDFPFKY